MVLLFMKTTIEKINNYFYILIDTNNEHHTIE